MRLSDETAATTESAFVPIQSDDDDDDDIPLEAVEEMGRSIGKVRSKRPSQV